MWKAKSFSEQMAKYINLFCQFDFCHNRRKWFWCTLECQCSAVPVSPFKKNVLKKSQGRQDTYKKNEINKEKSTGRTHKIIFGIKLEDLNIRLTMWGRPRKWVSKLRSHPNVRLYLFVNDILKHVFLWSNQFSKVKYNSDPL